jgi:hypothetical protein
MTSRRCQGTTKRGAPCRAKPLTGSDYCVAHSDAETRASMGFTPDAGKLGGRPPNPRPAEILRQRIEADIDKWYDVLIEAREAERAVVVGHGEHAEVEMVPEYGTRLAAFREALDRAWGKPKQATEITGADGGPVQVTDLSWLKP